MVWSSPGRHSKAAHHVMACWSSSSGEPSRACGSPVLAADSAPHDRLTAGQGQQVAFLCGIENIASLYRHLIARLQILKVDGCEVITVHRHIYRAMSYQTMEQTANLRSRIWPWSNRESAVFACTLGKIRRTRKPPKPISYQVCRRCNAERDTRRPRWGRRFRRYEADGFRRTYRRDIAGARFAGHGKSKGGWGLTMK
jgi:hypothetical protein